MNIEASRQLILSTLASGAKSSQELRQILGNVNRTALSRLINGLRGQIIVLGQSRATQYARPRDVRVTGSKFPVYRVDGVGNVHHLGDLDSLMGGDFWWQPASSGLQGQIYRHLPWFVQDMRPDGFMGRAFALRIGPDMGLSARLPDWNDDHVLVALARRGEDAIGDLIVGNESLMRYLERARQETETCTRSNYPHMAVEAMAGDPAGSSAAGEQPKFLTSIIHEGTLLHVMVKFSPLVSTPAGERWSDLLVCEHLALGVVQEAGIQAGRSTLITLDGRTFLEVERFDRTVRSGRLPLHSLGVIDDEFFGHRDNWTAMAGRLEQTGMMSQEDTNALAWLDLFGAMIGNTDRHFGNISLVPLDAARTRFRLAPAYDMLPMFYRPKQDEELNYSSLAPISATTARANLVDSALQYAAEFWRLAAADARISARFRALCVQNLEMTQRTGQGPRVVTETLK